jgi:hypothetical protein
MRRESLLVLIVLAAAALLYVAWQPQIQAGAGYGWDGHAYHSLYRYFHDGVLGRMRFPFCKRPGIPYLASLLPVGEFRAFLLINQTAGVVAAFAVYRTARTVARPRLAAVLTLPMVLGLFAPVRFTPFYPVYVDPVFMALSGLAMLALLRGASVSAAVLLTLSAFVREAALLTLLGVFVWALWIGRRRRELVLWGVALALAAAIGAAAERAVACEAGSVLAEVARWTYRRLSMHEALLRYTAGILVTLGPFIIAARRAAEADEHDTLGGIMLGLAMAAAFVGGSDVTRILFSSYPLFVLFLARRLDESWRTAAIVTASLVLLNKFPRRLEEPTRYTPDGTETTGFFGMFPDYGDLTIALSVLVFVGLGRAVVARRHSPHGE